MRDATETAMVTVEKRLNNYMTDSNSSIYRLAAELLQRSY